MSSSRTLLRRPRCGRGERGSVSVEMALVTPVALMIIFGGVHIGLALGTQHKISEATSFVTRSCALRDVRNAATIRAEIEARLGAGRADCSTLTVNAVVVNGPSGTQALQVQTTCQLAGWFNNSSLDLPFAPDRVSARAAFPLPIAN